MPEEKVPTTRILGVWVDPMAKLRTKIPKSQPTRVGEVVGMLSDHVITQVNDMYSLDPPLDSDDMIVHRYNRKLYLLYFLFIYKLIQ